MANSSDIVNYQIRPAKATERKMLCELIKDYQILYSISNDDVRYIGMGARYYSDFLLFHRELGISKMVSIESDENNKERYRYNNPLSVIDLRFGNTNEVLPAIDWEKPYYNVAWLDYDGVFSEMTIKDIECLCRNMTDNNLFFYSCNCFDNNSEQKKQYLEQFKEYFQRDISTIKRKEIPHIIKAITDSVIKETLRIRNISEGKPLSFIQLVFLKYRDGVDMMTYGGLFVRDEKREETIQRIRNLQLGFISESDQLYEIEVPNLTTKEILMLLPKIPVSEEKYLSEPEVYHGIPYKEIAKFQEIYRYYPIYSESHVKA